eukprot:Skav228197  [mRNA]  locus=scaffold704:167582:177633:- [translate_table: standard]
MGRWCLLFSLLVLASGHDGRKGPTGQRVLHPEVAMSLSAMGQAQEEARKGVMRRDVGSQSVVAPSRRKKTAFREDPEEEDSEAESTEATEEEATTESPTEAQFN